MTWCVPRQSSSSAAVAVGAVGQRVQRVLADEQARGADHVGDAGARRRAARRRARGCGTTARPRSCSSAEHDEHRAARRPVAEQLGGALGRRRVERRRVEDRERAALGVHRQRAAQRGAALLAVDLEGVAARLRAEDGAAAGPDRRARGAGAGAAGALLAPRLGAAAADLAARLRRRVALRGGRSARRARSRGRAGRGSGRRRRRRRA